MSKWLKVGEAKRLREDDDFYLTVLDIADLIENYSVHPVTSDPKEYASRAITFVLGHLERRGIDTDPTSVSEGTGETSPPKPSEPIELDMSKTIDEELRKKIRGILLSYYIEGNAPLTVRALENLISQEVIKGREDELRKIELAQQDEDRWSLFCMDDTSDFSNYISQRITQLRATESPLKPVKEDNNGN